MYEKPEYEELERRIRQLEREVAVLESTRMDSAKTASILEATLESTADGIVVVDFNGNVISYNRRFQSLCGFPDDLMASMDDSQIIVQFLKLVKGPESFIEKMKQIYENPDEEIHDNIEFKDGRFFERVSLPQVLNNKAVGYRYNAPV